MKNETVIHSRLCSPKEARARKIRREQADGLQALLGFANRYLIELGKYGTAHDTEGAVYLSHDAEWRKFVHAWNKNPMRLSEMRETDFEDLIATKFPNKQNLVSKIVGLFNL